MMRLLALFPLRIAAFCALGFLAAFEPGADPAHVWKGGFTRIGRACLALAGWLAFRPWKG